MGVIIAMCIDMYQWTMFIAIISWATMLIMVKKVEIFAGQLLELCPCGDVTRKVLESFKLDVIAFILGGRGHD